MDPQNHHANEERHYETSLEHRAGHGEGNEIIASGRMGEVMEGILG
jgi:hypothetical protein